MTKKDISVLSTLWFRLFGTSFSLPTLLNSVRSAGSLDTDRLTEDDLQQLFQGTFSGDWNNPAFSFGELLAYYAARCRIDGKLDDEHFVAWTFTVFVIADAIGFCPSHS